jgi:allantoin racemase
MKIALLVSKGQRNRGYGVPPHLICNGYETEVVETSLAVFPYTQIDHKLMEISTIEGGLQAAQSGFDAIFINTVGDYGLEALRSAMRIPVVGAGQATMLTAASLGRRFSIVTIWPPALHYIYENLLALYGLRDKCASILHVTSDSHLAELDKDENFVMQMRRGEKHMLTPIVEACKRAFREDGADTVMLGCTCMAPIAGTIAGEFESPVLDPLSVGYKFTEMLLSLQLTQSSLAYQRREDAPLASFITMAKAVSEQFADAECEVCEIARQANE